MEKTSLRNYLIQKLRPCKRAEKLETWRNFFLGGLLKRIKSIYIVKVAERYGMVTFHEWDKKFYFEREIKEK